MKRGENQIKFLSLLVIGLFLISFFIAGISADDLVEAQQKVGVLKTLWDSFFAGIFDGWTDASFSIGTYQVQISQFLLGFIFFLLVFSIAGFIPFLSSSSSWIKWSFSIAVALLSFLFIKAETIAGILTTYEALGVILTSVVPLVIIMVAMYKVREDPKLGSFAGFLSKFILIGFFFWMILKWGESTRYSTFYLGTAIIALVWIFLEKKVWRWLKLNSIKAASERGESRGKKFQITKLNNKIIDLQEAMRNEFDPDKLNELQKEIEITRRNIDALLSS